VLIDFEHRNAAHCETGLVSNLMNFYGFQLSEPMVFGISAGYFFVYMPLFKGDRGVPLVGFRTFPGTIINNAFTKLQVKINTKRFSNKQKDKAMQELDELLAEGVPVCNKVGMYSLSYMPRVMREHWNIHHFCVIGKEGNDYLVSEALYGIKRISYEDLKRVRFSEGKLKPLGKMYWVKEKPETIPDLRKLVVEGIKTTCRNMVGIYCIPMASYLGAKGIAKLSKYIRKLDNNLGEKAPIFLAKMIRYMEELSTGGAGYRFIYSAFLFEAADVLNKTELKAFSVEMNNIGNLWREFSIVGGRKLKNRNSVSYDELADRLLVIAAKEKEFFVTLRKFIKTECKK
jgi:hypothetical protein